MSLLDSDEQVLLLFLRGHCLQPVRLNPGAIIPAHDGSGPLHVAWERKLEERGVSVESRVNWPGGATSLYFRDSDGHAVELATPGLWTR